MKTKYAFFMMIFCVLFAGQVDAQQAQGFKSLFKQNEKFLRKAPRVKASNFPAPSVLRAAPYVNVIRPTVIYTPWNGDPYLKYECAYDEYGHITAINQYNYESVDDEGTQDYVLRTGARNSYQRLANGKFVLTGWELTYHHGEGDFYREKYSAGYDDKGMELWSQHETSSSAVPEAQVVSRTEARLVNGVRTAIVKDGVVNPRYTFDEKGRIVRDYYTYDDGAVSEVLYTWENDRLTGYSDHWTEDTNGDGVPDSTESYIYRNIQIAHNEAYFNPFSLEPLWEDDISYSYPIHFWGDFSVDDNYLQEVYYNLDATISRDGSEMTGQIRVTVNAAGNEIKSITTVNESGAEELVMEETLQVLDEYGSYYEATIEGDYEETIHYVQYNAAGELLQDNYVFDDKEGGSIYIRNEEYTREYDEQNRPIRTVYLFTERDESEGAGSTYTQSAEETYTAWTVIGATGLQLPERAPLSVYPNPAADFVRVHLTAPAEVVITDLSGRVVLRQMVAVGEMIPVDALAAGIYLLSTPAEGRTVRFIKN
jgi:hypothetical protein